VYGIRYHIMTLTAVFLALGLGLLLGGTLGEEVIVKEQVQLLQRLEERYTQVKSDNVKLQQQTTELSTQNKALTGVMSKVGGHYVRDRLIGRSIALLNAEAGDLRPLLNTLEQAGANVTAAVDVQAAVLQEEERLQEVRKAIGLPDNAPRKDVYEKVAATLATSFYGGKASSTTLDRLKELGLFAVTGSFEKTPDAVVLVGGASTDASKARIHWFDGPLLRQMTEQAHAVVAVERSGVGYSGVTQYREYGVSTVDNVDEVTGRVALIDILAGRARGHFGVKKTAEALLPHVMQAKEVNAIP